MADKKPKDKKWYQQGRWIIIFLIILWPLGVYFMWRYAKWKMPVKVIVSALELLFLIIFIASAANVSPYVNLDDSYYSTPKTDESSYLVSGTTPSNDIVKVNDIVALRSGDSFKATVPLKEGDNQITVVATNGNKQTQKNFIIHRNTSAEIKARNDAAAAAKKAADDAAKAQKATAAKAAADAAAAAAYAKANAPAEYKSALNQATSYANTMHMSKQGVYDQLVSQYGGQFSAAAAQYAIDNVTADWNANALAQAKTYQNDMYLSPAAVHDQLTSEYGGQFTQAEADYAIQHLND
jgi:Host cell surface-exposed lipoprotein.